jgi:hypothetical protein
VIESFRPRLPQIVYRRVEPALRYDRNLLNAVALARGQYCWLFGDDRLEPGGLAAVLEALTKEPNLTGLTTDRISYDSALANRLPVRPLKERETILLREPNETFLRLLDRLGLAKMNVDRRQHDHGDERPNTAATFRNFKAPVAMHWLDRCTNGVNRDPAETAQHFDKADDEELQAEGHLLDRA